MGHNVSRNGGKLIWDRDTMVWVYKSLYCRYTPYKKESRSQRKPALIWILPSLVVIKPLWTALDPIKVFVVNYAQNVHAIPTFWSRVLVNKVSSLFAKNISRMHDLLGCQILSFSSSQSTDKGPVLKFGPICLVITLARKRVKAKNVTNYKAARV